MNPQSGLPESTPRVLLAFALIGLGAILVLADLSPLFAARSARHAEVAQACRVALAPTCHQRAERSLHVGHVALASCARCVGLHAGGLLGGLVLLLWTNSVPSRARALVLAATAVLMIDVAAGALTSWDHALIRLVTGLVFVVALALAAGSSLERGPQWRLPMRAVRI